MMERIRSESLGCGALLIFLGGLGLLSTFIDMGSYRALWVLLFFELADEFSSVTMFSIVTIGVGILIILFILLDEEIRQGKAEKELEKSAQQNRSRDTW
jgi:hypothetical protein